MIRVLGMIVLVAAYISFFFDVLRTPRGDVRALPKWLWMIIVLIIPIIGGVLWLLLGRAFPSRGSRWRRRAPLAPDDDPSFLKTLDEEAWRERMRRRRGETGPDPAAN